MDLFVVLVLAFHCEFHKFIFSKQKLILKLF